MESDAIRYEHLLRPELHPADTAGTVFIAQDRVYRRISPDYQAAALKLLKSALFEELVAKRLFPKTTVNQAALARGELVLEHERAPFILQCWEWSFSMLKDAALTILAVAAVCEKHGYRLQVSHVHNIVFFSGRPMFVDFGSLREGQTPRCFPLLEFLRFGYIPLKLWSAGNFYIANRLLRDDRQGVRLQPFTALEQLPLLRKYVKPFTQEAGLGYWARMLTNMVFWQIPPLRKRLLDVAPYQAIDYGPQEIRAQIEALEAPQNNTEWETYHDASFKTSAVTPRFCRILDILGNYTWGTAVDLAGNSGYFTELLARRFTNAHLLCLDYDSRAIDKQYGRLRTFPDLAERITVGMVNVMYPEVSTLKVEERIPADLVLVLAVMHHLTLRQKADIDTLLQAFFTLTRQYLAIEFMPLGLWNGTAAPPLPAWYTKEWFKACLETRFKVLLEEQIEENRILFFCEKRPADLPGPTG